MRNLKEQTQTKLIEAQEKLKQQTEYFSQIGQALEKLSSDKVTALNNINILNGIIQAYSDTLNTLSKEESID
jgi:hypothetical protein